MNLEMPVTEAAFCLLGRALDVVVSEPSRMGLIPPDTGVAQVPVVLSEALLEFLMSGDVHGLGWYRFS